MFLIQTRGMKSWAQLEMLWQWAIQDGSTEVSKHLNRVASCTLDHALWCAWMRLLVQRSEKRKWVMCCLVTLIHYISIECPDVCINVLLKLLNVLMSFYLMDQSVCTNYMRSPFILIFLCTVKSFCMCWLSSYSELSLWVSFTVITAHTHLNPQWSILDELHTKIRPP